MIGSTEPTEELVTLARPGGEKDVTLLSEFGGIRFLEGRAHGVPLRVALKLAGPGWAIEPPARLEQTHKEGRDA
jgi:hypothetical protein